MFCSISAVVGPYVAATSRLILPDFVAEGAPARAMRRASIQAQRADRRRLQLAMICDCHHYECIGMSAMHQFRIFPYTEV
jgi:hypothetical protein